MQRHNLLIGVLVGLAACSSPTDPDNRSRRIVGLIDAGASRPTIVAPDTVRVDRRFTATVYTFGSSNCELPDGVELELSPSEARVTPYVRMPEGDPPCLADLIQYPHPVELRFTRTGPATIVVLGDVMGETPGRQRGSISRELVVVP